MDKTFRTKKSFGQHFLIDENIITKIIRAINPQTEDYALEIGPGQGAITKYLLPRVKALHVVELDRTVLPILKRNCQSDRDLTIHESDALKFDFNTLPVIPGKWRLVGNLPYNISTPLLFLFLDHADLFQDMHFMLQYEVAERIASSPNSKAYGRLSVMIQYFCDVKNLFSVSRYCFAPPPKVESAVIRLVPFEKLPHKANNFPLFTELVREVFNHRRKILRHTLKNYLTEEQLTVCPIDVKMRPEMLSVSDFVILANFVDGSDNRK